MSVPVQAYYLLKIDLNANVFVRNPSRGSQAKILCHDTFYISTKTKSPNRMFTKQLACLTSVFVLSFLGNR